MKTVIVTGGIGSGKSAVCAYLASQGVPVYDSDTRAKALYDRKPEIVDALEAAFGVPLRTPEGLLDRRRLAELIFADAEKRELLESLLYPALLTDFRAWKRRRRPAGWSYGKVPFVVLESAVILSKPIFDGLADRAVLVDADPAVRLERAVRRDNADPDVVRRRMVLQVYDRSRVDAVLVNDGPLDALPAQVDAVFASLFEK